MHDDDSVRFTLDQLRGFVAVAEERHFRKAAERLSMTQPPLSRLIQKLERAIGVQLLVRTPRAVQLTLAGAAFLDEARRVLDLAARAPLQAQRVAAGVAGTLRIGYTAIAALNVIGGWVKLAQAHLPDVDLVLTEMVTDRQVTALLAGEIDIGLLRETSPSATLVTHRVNQESLLLATPAGHPLTCLGRPPTLREVAEHDVVTYSADVARYFHDLVVSLFTSASAAPRYTHYAGQVNSILALVDAGLGVALVPEVSSVITLPHVQFTPVQGVDPACVELWCAWRMNNENPALAALLALA